MWNGGECMSVSENAAAGDAAAATEGPGGADVISTYGVMRTSISVNAAEARDIRLARAERWCKQGTVLLFLFGLASGITGALVSELWFVWLAAAAFFVATLLLTVHAAIEHARAAPFSP